MTDLIPRDALVEAMRQLIGEGKEQWIQGNNSAVNACIRTALAIPAIDHAAIREAALETPAFSRLVEEAKNAVEVLRFAVTEIQDLENTLSSYRQNWANADAAANSLSAAILALIGEKK